MRATRRVSTDRPFDRRGACRRTGWTIFAADRPARRNPAAGFTLIEVIGAFFMMVIILVFVGGIFVENGRQRSAASELMRERLSATAGLEMISSDLESAIHLMPAEGATAETHPWRFLAERRSELGSTAVRFVTQNASQSNRAEHASSWIEVAYFLEEDDSGESVLWRWSSARPPDEQPRGFPDAEEPGSARIAIGVSEFGIRFRDIEGNWLDDWDSSYQPPEQALPEAAEISLGLLRDARVGETLGADADRIPGLLHTRRVAMVMRPIDVDALIELASGPGGDLDCFTVADCLAQGDSEWFQNEIAGDCGGDDDLCSMLENTEEHCWSEVELSYPGIASSAPAVCAS